MLIRHDAHKDAAQCLCNAAYEVNEAADKLEPYGWDVERDNIIRLRYEINEICTVIAPKRTGYHVTDEDREKANVSDT